MTASTPPPIGAPQDDVSATAPHAATARANSRVPFSKGMTGIGAVNSETV